MSGRIEEWKTIGYVYVERNSKGHFTTWHKLDRMYRMTTALNYVIHHRYYSYVIQRWALTEADLLQKRDEDFDRVMSTVEGIVGYGPSEWWFPPYANSGMDRVSFEEWLIGKVSERQEDLGGR